MAINPNDYEFRIWFDPDAVDEAGRFMAQVVEWPHLKADGHTPAQAAGLLREVLEGCLDSALKHGDPIPKPVRGRASVSQAAAALGRLGGRSKSPAKLAAQRKNAQKAGRPRKVARELVAA